MKECVGLSGENSLDERVQTLYLCCRNALFVDGLQRLAGVMLLSEGDDHGRLIRS